VSPALLEAVGLVLMAAGILGLAWLFERGPEDLGRVIPGRPCRRSR
jgi:hypothetical protein